MSDIFLRSDEALDAAISECTDPERIRELTKASPTPMLNINGSCPSASLRQT